MKYNFSVGIPQDATTLVPPDGVIQATASANVNFLVEVNTELPETKEQELQASVSSHLSQVFGTDVSVTLTRKEN